MAFRATGELLVTDPAGLHQVIPVIGSQRVFSGPLDADESAQVVIDGNGDAIVLEADEIATYGWSGAGMGSKTSIVTMPFDAVFALFRGDSLVRESDGKLLVTAFGFLGDGIFRVDPGSQPITYEMVSPALSDDRFKDLALESDGTILAVGTRVATGETGVFRVVPSGGSMGATTTLTADPAWTSPVAVAVAASGDIFVADEGSCDPLPCTGATVVRVDPVSGARLDVWSGGSITGPMDLALVTALPECQDGDDDDSDGLIDYTQDVDCLAPWDPSEEPDCSDGLDNDGDGFVDHPNDPGCWMPDRLKENPQCDDGLDNDGDGLTDFPSDPNCGSAAADREAKKPGCGLTGGEALPVLGLLAWRRRRTRR